MRIAYVCYWNAFRRDGVSAKIASQAKAWQDAGHEVRIFCVSPATNKQESPALDAVVFSFRHLAGRAAATGRLLRSVDGFSPEIAYIRYDRFFPTLRSMQRHFVSVVEVNTDDRQEGKFRRTRARLYGGFNRRALLGRAAGLVCVTPELARLHAALGKPTAVIPNGVDLEGISQQPPTRRGRPRLVFLASEPAPWHGLDKALFLARRSPDWDFAFVGIDAGAIPGDLPANVTAYGSKPRSEYASILSQSDIGLGPLALHRKGMAEACPLKVREYLAYGLPTIVGHVDTDFSEREPWFLLRLPNVDANVREHLDEIRAFVNRVRGRRVPIPEVAPIISMEAKEAARLAFFSDLLANRR